MKRNQWIMLGLAAIALVSVSVGASALILNKDDSKKPVVTSSKHVTHKNNITWDDSKPAPAPQQVASNCDDGNIVGTVLGGAAGGVAGNQIGKGNGNTAATIAGAVGGAYVGNQYIPTRNVLCKK